MSQPENKSNERENQTHRAVASQSFSNSAYGGIGVCHFFTEWRGQICYQLELSWSQKLALPGTKKVALAEKHY
jgi:hypothetical protein